MGNWRPFPQLTNSKIINLLQPTYFIPWNRTFAGWGNGHVFAAVDSYTKSYFTYLHSICSSSAMLSCWMHSRICSWFGIANLCYCIMHISMWRGRRRRRQFTSLKYSLRKKLHRILNLFYIFSKKRQGRNRKFPIFTFFCEYSMAENIFTTKLVLAGSLARQSYKYIYIYPHTCYVHIHTHSYFSNTYNETRPPKSHIDFFLVFLSKTQHSMCIVHTYCLDEIPSRNSLASIIFYYVL